MNDRFEPLQLDDVISSSDKWFMPSKTYTLEEFYEAGRHQIKIHDRYPTEEHIVQEVNCKVLQADRPGWRSGKMRVRVQLVVEFLPDQSDKAAENLGVAEKSVSLDTIRQNSN